MSQGGWDKARWVGEAEWRDGGMGQDWWGLGRGGDYRRWRRIREERRLGEGEGRCPELVFIACK